MAASRNKIPCSAARLGLLDPPMIEGVVEAAAFKIGKQYLAENRIRIVQADESQISSAVIGNTGLYEQTIRLKDGYLISKCSCTQPEDPICRHCIAVLLEYHRWSQPRQARKPPDSDGPSTAQVAGNGHVPVASQGASPDLKLSEVMAFMEWLKPAMAAIEQDRPLPALPATGPGDIAVWMQTISRLDERRREGAVTLANMESDLRDREAYIGRLTQQLQTAMAEAKTAHMTVQELQQNINGYQGLLARVAELAGDVSTCDGQLKAMAQAFLAKSQDLDKLANSCRSVSDALKAIGKASA